MKIFKVIIFFVVKYCGVSVNTFCIVENDFTVLVSVYCYFPSLFRCFRFDFKTLCNYFLNSLFHFQTTLQLHFNIFHLY